MARKAREISKSGNYYITLKGNELFVTDEDKKMFVEILEKKSYDVSVLNTICNATKERQTEAESIAESVDAMIVIGDKHSSNTQKLVEICRKACDNTYYIQTLDDLDLNQLGSVETVVLQQGHPRPTI